MKLRTFPTTLALLVLTIALVNALAIHYAWYWSVRWFDMPMHILGGVWVAASVLWFRFKQNPPTRYAQGLLWGLGGAMAIGLSWEVYESAVSYIATGHIHDLVDTLSDLACDSIGGTLASLYIVSVGKD